MNICPIALSALSTAEKLSLSGEMLLRGLGTVFMVLIILLWVLMIFGKVFGSAQNTAKKSPAPATVPQKDTKVSVESTAVPTAVSAAVPDDKELIAVITAAIAAYQSASGQPNMPFRVVSFTRKNNASGWMRNSADNQ